jgi:hypothetical protein
MARGILALCFQGTSNVENFTESRLADFEFVEKIADLKAGRGL